MPFLFFLLVVFMFLPHPVIAQETPSRGLFVSVIQEPPVLASRKSIEELVDYAQKAHINALFVQIYRANQAWFPSAMADHSPYDACLKSAGEDPFDLLIRSAHARGISVHAWVNLLSLSKNTGAPLLKKYGPEILTRSKQKKKVLDDYKIDKQFFLEPGDPRIREELTIMVTEVVKRYPDLDGIQFDYIRYPDQNPHYGFTRINMDRFKEAAGKSVINDDDKAWKDWKRDQVTTLLKHLVKTARTIHPGILVSTTGCAPYSRAFDEAFQDWPTWVNSGLTDFVTVMTYAPDPVEFSKLVDDAALRVKDPQKMHLAIGAYMNARSPEAFADQVKRCEAGAHGPCVTFHYGSLVETPALKDILH